MLFMFFFFSVLPFYCHLYIHVNKITFNGCPLNVLSLCSLCPQWGASSWGKGLNVYVTA